MNLFDVCTSDLVILKASATVAEAARLMRDRHVGCVIVFGDTLLAARLASSPIVTS